MANVIIHCYYTGEDGAVRRFVDEMQDSGLQKEVWDEDGCLQYDYFISARDENVGVLVEKWRNAAALEAHSKGAPMSRLLLVKEKYGLETKVERYELKD